MTTRKVIVDSDVMYPIYYFTNDDKEYYPISLEVALTDEEIIYVTKTFEEFSACQTFLKNKFDNTLKSFKKIELI